MAGGDPPPPPLELGLGQGVGVTEGVGATEGVFRAWVDRLASIGRGMGGEWGASGEGSMVEAIFVEAMGLAKRMARWRGGGSGSRLG